MMVYPDSAGFKAHEAEEESIKRSKMELLLREIKEAGLTSSVLGIPHLARQGHIGIKSMWLICLLGSSSLCFVLLVQSIQRYLEYETMTSLDTIDEFPASFPAVTLCNMNPLVTKESIELSKELIKKYINQSIKEIHDSNKYPNDFIMMNLLKFMVGANIKNLINSSDVAAIPPGYKLGHSLKDIVLSCTYNVLPCDLDNNFAWYYDSYYGDCFTFNGGRNQTIQKATRAGNLNGLVMELLIDQVEDIYSLSMAYGLHVFIHNATERFTMYDGFDVSTGTAFEIGVSRSYSVKLPSPYSDCVELSKIQSYDSEFIRLMSHSSFSYRQSTCNLLILQKLLAKNCSCQDINVKKIPGLPQDPCLSPKDFNCIYAVMSEFFQKEFEPNHCPRECEKMSFEFVTSHTGYPTMSYYEELLKSKLVKISHYDYTNATYDEMKSKLMMLNVYYNNMDIKHNYETPQMSFLDLLSNFGGFLGLFIGVSILSFVELVDVAVRMVLVLFK